MLEKGNKGRWLFSWSFSAPVLLPHVANNSTQCFLLDLGTHMCLIARWSKQDGVLHLQRKRLETNQLLESHGYLYQLEVTPDAFL